MATRKRYGASLLLEYARFLSVGALNTATDFLVMNALLFLSGTTESKAWYVIFKSISFLAAVTQSYFLNRHWVFSRPGGPRPASAKERRMFFAVSAAGFAVNAASSLATFAILGRAGVLTPRINANMGALAGSALTQVSNYLGYKFLVFKNHHESHIPLSHNPRIQGVEADREHVA